MSIRILTVVAHWAALSGQYLYTILRPTRELSKKHRDAPVAEQKHTRSRAIGKGKRNPERIERKMEPGIANVWRLKSS